MEAIHKNAVTARQTDSMIRRITVRDVASYGSKGVTLENLQRVNFIYGSNGSGKTTLSRLLASGKPQGAFKNCEVEWTDMPLKVLAYNRDFRERNLSENIPGVFTLGEDSVEAERRLGELEKELGEANLLLASKHKRMEAKKRQIKQDTARLRDSLWNDVLLPQQDYFGPCLEGAVTSKAQFARLMQAQVESGEYRNALGREALQERFRQLFRGERMTVMAPIEKPEEEYAALKEVTGNGLWRESIVAVKGDGERTGEVTIEEGEVCPYCGQRRIPEVYRLKAEEYYNNRYAKEIEEIRTLTKTYKAKAGELKEKIYAMLTRLQHAPCGVGKHEVVIRMYVELLGERMETNLRIMVNKLENPAMVVRFKDVSGVVDSLWQNIDATNEEIAEYNKMAANVTPERERLTRDVITYLAGRSASTVKYCQQATASKRVDMTALEKEAKEIMKKTQAIDEEKKGLEKKLASTKPTVERINNELRRYGFTGFSIQPTKKGTTYQIQREDGSLVRDTLSEGETTFITFLYYLQLVKGGETNSNVQERKVLVIDDPISSLDSKVMGAVSDMVRQVMLMVHGEGLRVHGYGDISQVFVLTHNTEFYKKVTWVNPRNNKRRGWHHWLLDKWGGETCVTAYGEENPVKMGYEQTWRELKENVAAGRPVQVLMRNIIETYFVEYGGYEKSRLIAEHFAEDEVERTQMTALMEWIDTGCHKGEEATFAEAPVVTNRRRLEEFRRLFERLGHEAHYRMMMRE